MGGGGGGVAGYTDEWGRENAMTRICVHDLDWIVKENFGYGCLVCFRFRIERAPVPVIHT